MKISNSIIISLTADLFRLQFLWTKWGRKNLFLFSNIFIVSLSVMLSSCLPNKENSNSSQFSSNDTPVVNSDSDANNQYIFITQPPVEGDRAVMDGGLALGELIIFDDCIQVKTENGFRILAIWPPNYSLNTDEEEPILINEFGQEIATIGDIVEFGGGEVEEYLINSDGQQIPDKCFTDSIVIVGRSVHRVDK